MNGMALADIWSVYDKYAFDSMRTLHTIFGQPSNRSCSADFSYYGQSRLWDEQQIRQPWVIFPPAIIKFLGAVNFGEDLYCFSIVAVPACDGEEFFKKIFPFLFEFVPIVIKCISIIDSAIPIIMLKFKCFIPEFECRIASRLILE